MRYPLSAWLVVLILLAGPLHSQDLGLGPQDLRIEQSLDGGYLLSIRQKPGVASVLLTESTEDPTHQAASYAWRPLEPHPTTRNERRILDGEFIQTPNLWFLTDSTPEPDAQFGQAFRIFIPYIIAYGYPWTRYGEQQVLDGTYVSVRTFTKPHADYRGDYRDNPFVLRVSQLPFEGPPEGNYMDDTVEAFTEIAAATEGLTKYSKGLDDVVPVIEALVRTAPLPDLDLVICLDATKSMDNDLPFLKKELVPALARILEPFTSYRIGLVQYRDYLEEFLYQTSPFTNDLAQVQKSVDRMRAMGGRDIPEAVNEALYGALKDFVWVSGTRMIILVGDAPPHPIPRGSVSAETVRKAAKEKGVIIHTIILPQ